MGKFCVAGYLPFPFRRSDRGDKSPTTLARSSAAFALFLSSMLLMTLRNLQFSLRSPTNPRSNQSMIHSDYDSAGTAAKRAGKILAGLAWCSFIASFFLPATNVLEMRGSAPGTPMTGWETMRCTLLALHPIVLLVEPRALFLLAFPPANLAMLLSPLFFPAAERIWPSAAFVFVLAGGLPWILPSILLGEQFIGLWLWQASLIAMAVGWVLAGIET